MEISVAVSYTLMPSQSILLANQRFFENSTLTGRYPTVFDALLLGRFPQLCTHFLPRCNVFAQKTGKTVSCSSTTAAWQ